MALALNEEFKRRFDNSEDHKSAKVIRELPTPDLPEKGFTEPPQAMPDGCKHEDPVKAYREYYRSEKTHLAEWAGRPTPSFMRSS